MHRAIVSAAFVVAFIAGASAQVKPDFRGTWKIDPARSDRFSSGAPTETITVEGTRMTVSRTRAGKTESVVYMLDGTPSKNLSRPGGPQMELIYTSTWEGNVLVTTIVLPKMTRIEKRWIQADGTMKNEVTFKFPHKTETGWMVFTKTR